MPIRTDKPAPYAPVAAVLSVISGYRDRGLSKPFTLDVLERAGVGSSLASRTLVALQGLDLIDDGGQPTEALEGLRMAASEDFQDRLTAVVKAAYHDIFQYTDPAEDPRGRIEDAFRAYKPPGQRKRMVILFLGLCQAAGMIPEDAPLAKTVLKPRTHTRTRSTKKAATSVRSTTPSQSKQKIGSGVPAPIAGLLTAIPADGWTQDERDKFVATFKAVLDFSVPIRENEEWPQTEPVEGEV